MVSEYLSEELSGSLAMFSVDIKDFYFSLQQDLLGEAVGEAIDTHGDIRFQNAWGINTSNFIEALTFYRSSTIIVYNDALYVQKDGVCVRSCLAPILSDLLLASFHRKLRQLLKPLRTNVTKISRFFDDFLVL